MVRRPLPIPSLEHYKISEVGVMKGEGCLAGESTEGLEKDSEGASQRNPSGDDGEFQITIRKLELPVRPRGVLAE
jgi:hypothetical protein